MREISEERPRPELSGSPAGFSHESTKELVGPPFLDGLGGRLAGHIKLGTNVVILPEHQPVVFAKTAATVDFLSGGRLEPMDQASHFIRHLTRIDRYRVYSRPEIRAAVESELRRRFPGR